MGEMMSGPRWTMIWDDCGDVMRALPDRCVDHIITDPPYSEEFHAKGRSGGRDGYDRVKEYGFDGLAAGDYPRLAAEFHRLALRWTLAFSDPDSAHLWRAAMVAAGMRYKRQGAWIKLGCTPQFSGDGPASGHEAISIAYADVPGRSRWNGGGDRAVWTCPIASKDREHTTQKPIALMLELVELFTDPEETILDPFAGSGTTGVAAIRCGRRFVGIERDETYFKLACDRLRAEEQETTLVALRGRQLPLLAGVK